MQKDEKILYDLPCVLFEDYLKLLGVSEISVQDVLYYNEPVKSRYAELPGKTEFETTSLLLLDRRFDNARSVDLLVLNNTDLEKVKSRDVLDLHTNIQGVIITTCTSSSDRKIIDKIGGSQQWLSARAQPGNHNRIQFSFQYSKNSIMHFAELIKRGQLLYCSDEYGWINSYFGNKEGYKPLEIQGIEVERPFLKY